MDQNDESINVPITAPAAEDFFKICSQMLTVAQVMQEIAEKQSKDMLYILESLRQGVIPGWDR